MSSRANTLFYALSAFVLMTAVFVMQPSSVPEVTMLQTEIKTQFVTAFQQTIGDQPFFDDVILVFEGVSAFYEEAATSTIALLEDREADADLVNLYAATYEKLVATLGSYVSNQFGSALASVEPAVADEEAGLNISSSPVLYFKPAVSGSFVDNSPVNLEKPWVTIQDNYTSQLYCLAIYNGEVNKYLGPCQDDYQ